MFSITLCFASTSQEATTTAPTAPHGISHDWKNGSGSMPMASNMARRECREHAAAERDQHVVDEELAREADEVHAALDLAPAAAGVRDADDEPQRYRQVERGQHLGRAVGLERIDVGEHGGRDERRREPPDGAETSSRRFQTK